MQKYVIILIILFMCGSFVLSLSTFTLHHVDSMTINVSGNSNYPTLPDKCDIFLTSTTKIERGIFVIVKDEDIFGNYKLYSKRIIGIPGDIVRNRLTDNLLRIPQNKVYVEGDNYNDSYDSTYFGLVSFKNNSYFSKMTYYKIDGDDWILINKTLTENQLKRVVFNT